jgi:hypothetical protein
LTDEERDSVADFFVPTAKRQKISYADEVLESKKTEYPDVHVIPPTSNIVERFFSTAKHVYTDYRAALSDSHLECLLFLELNKRFWSAEEIRQIVKKIPVEIAEGPEETEIIDN